MKRTLVLGASLKPYRYSHIAIKMLNEHKVPVIAIGNREGEIHGIPVIKGQQDITEVHTVTLYLGPKNQLPFYEYIISLGPKRIIFNPGTENEELVKLAAKHKIEVVIDCTLNMLSENRF